MRRLSDLRLAWRHVVGSPFRSWVVLLCTAALAGLAVSSALIVRGAEGSLRLARERLGADIIVVPEGTQARVESALLMGAPTRVWMPRTNLERIAALPGVAAVSPQLYLSSLARASCCSASEMFVVAYDPASDFTVRPWLGQGPGAALQPGEAIGGSSVFAPEGEGSILLYGSDVRLRGNLAPTGTGLDRTLFLTFETAAEIARNSWARAEQPLELPRDGISAALVRLQPGADPRQVALRILQEVPGAMPIEGADMFRSFRSQIAGLLRAMLTIVGVTAGVSLVLLGLVFSLAAHERQREVAILRALGAPAASVCRCLLAEAALLAAGGAALGIIVGALAVHLFRGLIVTSLGVPFLFPPLADSLAFGLGGIAVTLAVVSLAALGPALAISRREPAQAMGL